MVQSTAVGYAFTGKIVCDLDVWTHDLQNSQSAFLTIFGLTLTFDLLMSKSRQFIFAPKCTEVVNMAKFPQATRFVRYRVHKLFAYDRGHIDTQTARKQNAFGGWSPAKAEKSSHHSFLKALAYSVDPLQRLRRLCIGFTFHRATYSHG